MLSIVQRYTLGTSFWGMGEFQSILPRVVVLGVFPVGYLAEFQTDIQRLPLGERIPHGVLLRSLRSTA